MKLHLLGTTGYHPNDRRQTACLMLPEMGVVFDAGTGMYRVREHLVTDTLDIFITHAHLDHIVGLTYLFDVMQNHSIENVTIHGEQEKLAAIQTHLFSEFLFPVMPSFRMQPVEQNTRLPVTGHSENAILTHFPLEHPGGSIGYRIDWPDRSMAYVTDTVASPDAAYIEKIRGVDLLIHECYFGDEQPGQAALTGHSCLTPVTQVAAAAQVGRLILVHINPMLEDDREIQLEVAQKIFPNTQIGVDRMELVL